MIRGLLTLLIFSTATAAYSAPVPYPERTQGQRLIENLQAQGLDAVWVHAVLADAHHQPKIIAAMQRPAEKVLPWHKYRQIFLKPERVKAGIAFINKHALIFRQVERYYGVPPAIIAAILGVETHFGRHTGNDRVLDALATLGFDYPPRAQFFYAELGKFLLLCQSEGLDPLKVKGSYAGAMGMPQFIASSYAAYAVDFNHNGKRDLWNEPADIIGSVANYFSEHGWRPGEAIAAPAYVDALPQEALELSERKTRYIYADFARAGIHVEPAPPQDFPVGLLEFSGTHGPEYWAGYNNFFVITSYNHSPLYALAVYQLSQAIAAGMGEQLPDYIQELQEASQ